TFRAAGGCGQGRAGDPVQDRAGSSGDRRLRGLTAYREQQDVRGAGEKPPGRAATAVKGQAVRGSDGRIQGRTQAMERMSRSLLAVVAMAAMFDLTSCKKTAPGGRGIGEQGLPGTAIRRGQQRIRGRGTDLRSRHV